MTDISHDFLSFPVELYAMVILGILLAATFLYLMRCQDRALAENRHIKELLDPIDFAVEVIFASCSGFGGFFCALYFDGGPVGVVMAAHAAAYVNRPLYLIANKHGGAILLWLLHTKTGIRIRTDTAEERQRMIAELDRQRQATTDVDEKIRLWRRIEDLKKYDD